NIPASIKLAQAALESNYGRAELALEANNFFGIKCWDCETSYAKVDDEKDAEGNPKASTFKVFSTPMESFKGHTAFLAGNKERYGHLFQLAAGDYRSWAVGLQEAGYATDSGYAEKLINIIIENNLHMYDLKVIGGELASSKTDALDAMANIKLDDSKVNGEEDVFANMASTDVSDYKPAFMKQD
ncbi:MAG: glycoside hydrolase family 73 protein, partial [Saprospiraceae bacterium]